MIPLKHCSAVWAKNPFGVEYKVTIKVSEEYLALDDDFSMRSKPSIKIRYPDVELTFLGKSLAQHKMHNQKERVYMFAYKCKLINERKVKTQKTELF